MTRVAPCVLGLALFALASCAAPEYDVVVYGGTSAGVTAAVQVSRMGKRVVIVEPGRHLGGMSSAGLGMTDSGKRHVIGGLSREFYARVQQKYRKPEAWRSEQPEDYRHFRADADAMWRFEPHVAEEVFEDMVREAGVVVKRGLRIDDQDGVRKRGTVITALVAASGQTIRASMFIDASYEGDLMAQAGVSHTTGREANATHGESLNGVQTAQARHHQFEPGVDPHVIPGDPTSGLVARLHGGPPGEEGGADHRIQSYCFRLCLTDDPANRVPFHKPDGYDEREYELLLRNFEAGSSKIPLTLDALPNRKTDTNNNGAFSTDDIGMNYAYPGGDHETRQRILKQHEAYQRGLLWTLAHHPRVPQHVRAEVSRWGLARDEFRDNRNWPHQIYVRESRRMLSDHVQTQLDCTGQRETPESVGMGSYNMDSHNVQRYVDAGGHVRNEGDVQISPGGPYEISYRAIRPHARECTNLLVPVCLAASHIAYGSIRMEPVFMVLGQSAGAAAVLALEDGVSVQRVPYGKLRKRLLAAGQVLESPPDKR